MMNSLKDYTDGNPQRVYKNVHLKPSTKIRCIINDTIITIILTTIPQTGCLPNAGDFAGIEPVGQKSSSTHANMTARHEKKAKTPKGKESSA